ncbi:histidine decarboxylase [Lentisphaerota bacterium ZTH]|nr:histidine decarboxylase [Lentisphaerota bacterium]WET07115.1 histidine decarboxylase [Lentisphaerota bacterium ZTH]
MENVVYQRILSETNKKRLERTLENASKLVEKSIGYPCNFDYDYSELLPFLSYSFNNLGDPFNTSNYSLNSMEYERDVIDFFADLTEMPLEERWGYVTNGGTEGNLYGLFLARETLPGAVVYYSEDTHYSIGKALRLLNMRCIMIRHQENGEIDYEDLKESVKIHRDSPAIVLATAGTTMTGAVDNIEIIREIFKENLINDFYIHVDAALSGMILPFVDEPQPWNFRDGADSISISGHKFIGAPMPCGVVLAKKTNRDRVARSIEYVGALDTTLTGSRNGLTPIMLWYAINRDGVVGFSRKARYCLDLADYALNAFNKCGIAAWRNMNANTIVFPKPSCEVLERWDIAVHRDIAHIITMPSTSHKQIDELVNDLIDYPA